MVPPEQKKGRDVPKDIISSVSHFRLRIESPSFGMNSSSMG